MNTRATLVAVAAATVACVSPAYADPLDCEVVATRGDTDPEGNEITNRFRPQVAINSGGDVLFTARPRVAPPGASRDRLYLYGGDGTNEVIAKSGEAAPAGLEFKTNKTFFDPSINDDGDLAFWARLAGGEFGVFGRTSGGALEKALSTGDASPCGGGAEVDEIEQAAPINSSAVVAFLQENDFGDREVNTYDLSTDTAGCALEEGDTVAGREVCTILAVGLGDSGTIVVHAKTDTSCAVPADPKESILSLAGGGSIVAQSGDATPIGVTTFDGFFGTPRVTPTDTIAFIGEFSGTADGDGAFTFSPLTKAIAEGDTVPDLGGTIAAFGDMHIADDGTVFVNTKLKGSKGKVGISTATDLLLDRLDVPPDPPFAAGASYRKISDTNDVAASGTVLAVRVTVKDTSKPKKKETILRCGSITPPPPYGSASRAFLVPARSLLH